jgi:hypothetical protein
MSQRFLVEIIAGTSWTCIRPQKRYTHFRHSVQMPGWAELGCLVDPDSPIGESRLDSEGRLWATQVPSVERIIQRCLNEQDWVSSWVLSREAGIHMARSQINRLTVDPMKEVRIPTEHWRLADELELWAEVHRLTFKFILLNALVVDELGELFQDFLIKHVGPASAMDYLTQLFATPYAREASEGTVRFLPHTDIHSRVDRATMPLAITDLAPVSELDGTIMTAILTSDLRHRPALWQEFSGFRFTVPLLAQLNDEQAYFWRAYGRLIMNMIQEYEIRRIREHPDFLEISKMSINAVVDELRNT